MYDSSVPCYNLLWCAVVYCAAVCAAVLRRTVAELLCAAVVPCRALLYCNAVVKRTVTHFSVGSVGWCRCTISIVCFAVLCSAVLIAVFSGALLCCVALL